jgi:butyryl-CoA dehydrogenase
MIDSLLTDEQKLLRETIRKFAEKEIKPYIAEWEKSGNFPWREIFLEKMGSMGFLGTAIPQEYGGYGGGIMDIVILMEEFNRYGLMPPLTHISACSRCIAKFGAENQKKRYLPDLATGKKLGAYAQTEPDAGSDSANMKATAILKNDHYVLNGRKCFISNADRAEIFIVLAKTDPLKKGKGISAFVVEKGFRGFYVGKKEETLGFYNQMPHSELIFEDCIVPKENLLVKEGDGFKMLMREFNSERLGNSASCLGMAEGAFEETIRYVKEREVFGKKLSEFQGVRWMIADMAIGIEGAKLLIYNAAYRADRGLNIAKEAAIAKTYTNEMVIKITNMAMQLHGAYGYSKEFPLEKFMRDSRGLSFGGGTPQILRDRIAYEILK